MIRHPLPLIILHWTSEHRPFPFKICEVLPPTIPFPVHLPRGPNCPEEPIQRSEISSPRATTDSKHENDVGGGVLQGFFFPCFGGCLLWKAKEKKEVENTTVFLQAWHAFPQMAGVSLMSWFGYLQALWDLCIPKKNGCHLCKSVPSLLLESLPLSPPPGRPESERSSLPGSVWLEPPRTPNPPRSQSIELF